MNTPFALHHYRPRVPYALPMVTAHQIRDLSLHPSSGVIIAFYEDVAPLCVNAEWAQLMQPSKGQYLVTAHKGDTLLLDEDRFLQLFIKTDKDLHNGTTILNTPDLPDAEPARNCSGRCEHCRSHG